MAQAHGCSPRDMQEGKVGCEVTVALSALGLGRLKANLLSTSSVTSHHWQSSHRYWVSILNLGIDHPKPITTIKEKICSIFPVMI